MNEEALKYSFDLFKNDGYNDSFEDYKKLISSNSEALNYAHQLFVKDGYNGNLDDFSELLGVKKKDQSQSGSNQTQPGNGSNNSQFDQAEYLRRAKEAGWNNTEEYHRAGHRYKENVSDEELAYIQPNNTNKKVIYRGTREELESQIAGDVKKEVSKSYTSESTVPKQAKQQPVRTAEEEQANTKVRKLSDITYMNENPDDFYSTYYDIFNKEAQKSGNPEQFEKDLKDKYADDFIDEEFKEEYTIATELRYIQDKMKKEIEAIKNSPSSNTPDGQKYLQSKIAEYTNLIKSKTSKLDEVRKNNNQRYQQRIDEIDNLFKTGEAAMREDNLMAEKNNLIRRMNLIKLAENPMALKEQVGEAEYKKIPGSTADEKLNNYLNTKLTIYDQFKSDAVDAAFDKNKYYGKKKDRAENVFNTYVNLHDELKDLYYLSTLRRYVNPEERSNFFQAAGEGFLRDFAGGMLNFDDVGRKHSENLQKIAEEAGIQYSDKDKSFIEYTSAPAQPWSGEWWGDMSGTSSAFMTELALTRKPTNVALEAAGAAIKAAPQISKIAKGVLSRYDKLGKTGQKFVNTVFNAAEEGVYFEATNQMLHNGESSELTFLTGFTGGLLAAPVNAALKKVGGGFEKAGSKLFDAYGEGVLEEVTSDAISEEQAAILEKLGAERDVVKTVLSQFVKPTAGNDAVYMIAGTFGKETPKVIDLLSKVGTHLIARPTGEVAEEFGEDLASIYQETSNFEEFKTEFSARYPDADAATQFVVASYMMGVGFGGGNFIGDVFIKKSKQGYDALPPEQKKIADKAIAEADREIKDKESEVLNEQEMNTPKKEKSKEEVEWDNKKSEIETKIANHDSEISGLEEMKQSIYSKYGITDPKTQDISGLSEDDAQKIEAINSSIQSNKKNKAKEEVDLSLHDKKKPVIEEEEESPLAIHADQLINRNKENAVQESSTEEVLPREQGATSETGSQPQGMGQSVQGQEVTQEGEKVSQEGVNRLNKETFAEDVTPEQKAKVEEQNQKDEDEAIDEIYDFNEEVKSIGTKEQFKQFLRSLSPAAAFSRIAWHNTNKPTLEPREGQYYTNTRKNAEDTYKGENTFPAIVFGNAPKKATFDEVQDVNTEAVKGEGSDVVVTDDLSPAIGAEMNYREFVPTSADQIIPIGTKENIDAFKAFVEQQKTSEEAKPGAEQKIQPEISLSGLVNGWTAKSYYAFDPRSNNNVMEFAQEGKSFAEVVDLDGKKHIVVGLALEGDKRAYGAGRGRDRFSFASAELNETTPDNIVEILQNAARDNFKNLYKDFDYKAEPIKPITEINPELEAKKQSKPAEQEKVQPEAQEAVKEEVKPTEETPVEETKSTEEKEPEPQEQAKMEEEVAKSEAVSPKNVRELIGVYRKIFNLPYHKAFVSAMVSNRLIKQMAKRAGVTTEQMYQRLQFKKASEKDLPKGVKMQVDAWHGSPYEFDRFTTEKMGTGEGVQAFGWGLYFTDLKDIAESYANKLSKNKVKIPSKYLDALNRRWSSKRSLSEALNIDDGDFSKKIIEIGLENTIIDTQILIDRIEREIGVNSTSTLYKSIKEDLEILKELSERGIETEKQRNLYKVSLHEGKTPDQYTWLEWDKPISNTPISKIDKTILAQKIIESNDSLKGLSPNEQYIQMEVDGIVNALNGERAYKSLSRLLGGDQQASLFLLENGIDGVKYPAESLSRGRTSETARGFNYVVFDENAVSIEEVIKFQKDANTARGAMMIGLDGQAIIYALTDANASTPLHELAHVFEHYLTKEEKAKIIKAAKTTRWTRQTSEYFARGFEKYLAEGKSSDPIFEKFKQFLLDIYKAIKGSPIDVKLNKDMKAIYANMLGEDLTEDLGETLDENIEKSSSKEEEMAKSAVEELMTAKKKRGAKKIDEMKNVKEKYGQMGKKLDYIDRNFDKLIDKLGIVKSCWLE